MANFIATLLKLTSPADYFFWKIHIKSTFALIIYFEAVFTTNDILNILILSQITNIDEMARRNFLSFQALIILSFILSDNLLMYGQSNAEAL